MGRGPFDDILLRASAKVSQVLSKIEGDISDPKKPPSARDKADVADFVSTLWADADKGRKAEFSRTAKQRFGKETPADFYQAALQLEGGLHWEVWGKRASDEKDKWKHELTDPEIETQIRVRAQYLTANWHDIIISPNVNNITQILDKERAKTQWGDQVQELVKKIGIFGYCDVKSFLDTENDPRGLATEVICEPGSVFRTPYATSFSERDGCWYAIHSTIQNVNQVKGRYKKLKISDLGVLNETRAEALNIGQRDNESFDYTKLVDVLEVWLDDNAQEVTPLDEEELIIEISTLAQGEAIDAKEWQNHPQHIKKKLDWLDDLQRTKPENLDDAKTLNAIVELTTINIEEHMDLDDKNAEAGLRSGHRFKYPFGRKIVMVAGTIAEDVVSPYEFPWRKLFRRIQNETVPGRTEGRGNAEILWNSNKTLDTMKSRIADISLAVGIPQPYFNINDKAHLQKAGLNNDPTKPKFYVTTPPVFPSAQAPTDLFNLYRMDKENVRQSIGVGKVAFAQEPHPRSSGIETQTLLRQSQILITGEANTNLNNAIEDIIETRLLMYKQFYTDARTYFIRGQPTAINLSRLLSVREIQDPKTGKMVEEEIPLFEVRVKPNSNFPNQWELDFEVAMQMFQAGVLPREAVMDLLAQRYPQWGRNTEYYELSEATRIGLEVLAEQEEQEKAQQKDRDLISQAAKKKTLSNMLREAEGEPNNGGARSREKRTEK